MVFIKVLSKCLPKYSWTQINGLNRKYMFIPFKVRSEIAHSTGDRTKWNEWIDSPVRSLSGYSLSVTAPFTLRYQIDQVVTKYGSCTVVIFINVIVCKLVSGGAAFIDFASVVILADKCKQ